MEANKNISVDHQACGSNSLGEGEQVIIPNRNSTESWMSTVKRRKISFARRTNVIARNDMIVNDNLNKIKVEEDVQEMVELKEEVGSTVTVGDRMQVDGNVMAPPRLHLPRCIVRLERLQLPDSRISTGSTEETSSNSAADGSEQQVVQRDGGNINFQRDAVSSSSIGNGDEETQVKVLKRENKELKACNEKLLELLKEKNLQIAQLELRLVGLPMTASEDIVQTDGVNNVIPQEEEEQIENIKVVQLFDQVVRVLIQKRKPLGQTKWADQMQMLKTLRLVSKSWKESVDRLLKNDPVHLILCPDDSLSLLQFKRNYTPCSTIVMNTEIGKTNLNQLLASLKKNMAEYPRFDPLLTGHLMIDVDTTTLDDDWKKFSKRIVNVLMALGDRVLYLTVGLKTARGELTTGSQVSLRALLMKWLHLTPNLKSLSMDFGEFRSELCHYFGTVKIDQVPHLKHLETIQNSGGIVLHLLLKKNQQVSRLCLVGTTFRITEILGMDLQNLSEVGLFFRACSTSVQARWFGKLNSLPWQPSGLTIIYPSTLARSLTDAMRVLTPRVNNKLDHFSLELVMTPSYWEMELDLPLSLKQLKIKWCTDAWFPVNLKKLLKKVTCLETLELEMGNSSLNDIKKLKALGLDTSDNGKEQRIQGFWLFIKALGTANYWKHLPKLRSVKIKLVIKKGEQVTIERKDVVRTGMSTIGFQYIQIGNEADYNGF